MSNTEFEVVSKHQCTVEIAMLKTYTQPTEHSSAGPYTFKRGDHVSYTNVKHGEDINRDGHHTNLWGYQPDMKVYFWLGGTDHPKG